MTLSHSVLSPRGFKGPPGLLTLGCQGRLTLCFLPRLSTALSGAKVLGAAAQVTPHNLPLTLANPLPL